MAMVSNKTALRKKYLLGLRISIFLFATLSIFNTGCQHQKEPERPNILFIAVDDLRPELKCYGVDYVKSPNIDKLADNGIMFTQAYCQSAVCNPSRASLMTGLRPNSTRVLDLYTDFRQTIPDVITLPQHFKNNGYHTLAVGKIYHNTLPDTLSWSEPKLYIDGFPFDPDAVYAGKEGLELVEKKKEQILAEGRDKKYIDSFGEWYIKTLATECVDVPDNFYFDGAQTDLALARLEELSTENKPFFFGIGYYRPHLPFNVPAKYWDLYNRDSIPLAKNDYLPEDAPIMAINNLREIRSYSDFKDQPHPVESKISEEDARLLKHGYLASVSYVDAQIGRLLTKLEESGLAENTIIILWGDHGWKLGEHGSWCKMTNYGIDTRVPLIISTPELKGKHIDCNRLVEFVDIYPTLCELAGLEIPETLEGTSAVPLMKDPGLPWKKAVFSQFLREGVWVAPDNIPYNGTAIRTNKYLYVEWQNKTNGELAAQELYDLLNDPDENYNLALKTEYQEVVNQLSEQLEKSWKAAIPE